ncbi:hypothetical protein MKEN_00411200 [Mycena kentingensis (nom. inval.)]|nr:hypothetical protein MKEN_00411200 [Mycena kentingensis (nom. inval.)]
MSTLRRFVAWALKHELDPENIRAQLAAVDVPVSESPCRACADPCEDGHAEYPGRFKVDMETQMLGSVDTYRRQVLISTAATDWSPEITWARGSLASHLSSAVSRIKSPAPTPESAEVSAAGVFTPSSSTEISILNANHATIADDADADTVLVFPDYVAVAGVARTRSGAQLLCREALNPEVPRILGAKAEGSELQTWALPYACVITMCSHKRRDARCAIAAPKLAAAFTESLQRRGWSVDSRLEPEHFLEPPIEDFRGTHTEREAHVLHALKTAQTSQCALILFTSHSGGHKYAGLTTIYTPGGASVWYGRVTPHNVEAIVEETIVGGRILPALLRGGMGIAKPGCKSLHDW